MTRARIRALGKHRLENDRSSKPTQPARRVPPVALALATLLLWLHVFNVPGALSDVGVDSSWRFANVWFFATAAQAGVDFVLTCGPLGLLEWGGFDARLFWPLVVLWSTLAWIGIAATFALLILRLRTWPGRTLGLVLLILVDTIAGGRAVLLLLGATLLALDPSRRPRLALVWAALWLAVYASIKASYLLFALPCAAALVLAAGLGHGLAAALRRAALILTVFLLVWTLVAGQSPGNVLDYARYGWEISSGYGEALSQPAPTRLLALALAASAAALAALGLHVAGDPRDPRRSIAAGLAAVGLFLAFKMSFTRHGGADSFFAFALLLPVLVRGSQLALEDGAVSRTRSRALLGCLVACGLLAFVGLPYIPRVLVRRPAAIVVGHLDRLRHNAGLLFGLPAWKQVQARRSAELSAAWDLPAVRSALDGRGVDLLGVEQAALVLGGLDWQPRPVFQGYHTYTPALRALNLEAFLAPSFPRHVLVKPYAIGEGHFPHQDEPDLLRLVARDFRPLLEERGFLLLERVATARPLDPATLQPLLEEDAAPGDWIELPAADGAARVLHVELPWTLAGRALGLAYHYPRVALVYELEDGSQGRGRITPTVARDGILLDPLLETLADWRGWYAGERGRRLRRIAIEVEPWAGFASAARARVRVSRDPDLR